MKYIKVHWHLPPEDYKNEPIQFFHEVDGKRSVRGFEVYTDGTYQILPTGIEVPAIEEINKLGEEFSVIEIPKEEFLHHWGQFEDEIREMLHYTLKSMIQSVEQYKAEEIPLADFHKRLRADFHSIYSFAPAEFYECWNPNWGNLDVLLAQSEHKEFSVESKMGEIEHYIEGLHTCLKKTLISNQA